MLALVQPAGLPCGSAGMTDLSELRRLNDGDGFAVDGESVRLSDDEWELATAGVDGL